MRSLDPDNTPRTRLNASLLLFAVPFCVYVYGMRYVGSGDTRASEYLAVSLVREGDFDLDEFVAHGEEMPYSFARSGDRTVNLYTPVPGMMNVPVFLAADLAGVDLEAELLPLNKVSMSMWAALSVVLMFHIILGLGFRPRRAFLLSLVFAFGTLLWSVCARGTWQHGPSVFLLCCALRLMQSERKAVFAWGGSLLALMCVNRPVDAIFAVPVFVYVLVHRRDRVAGFLLTALIPVAFMLWYSVEYWGSPLALGQGQSGKFTGSPLLAVPGMLISPARGLLVFSPVFVFAILYMVRDVFARGGRVLYRYMVAGLALTLVCYSFWERWSGGHCFGYRYLSDFLPVLMIFLAESWDTYIAKRRWTLALFWVLLAFSVYVNFLGAFFYPSGFDWEPDNTDFHPARYWSLDTEITRCHGKFMDALESRL
jgi:hypothetical protein